MLSSAGWSHGAHGEQFFKGRGQWPPLLKLVGEGQIWLFSLCGCLELTDYWTFLESLLSGVKPLKSTFPLLNLDCSQSPIFLWDRLDIPHLTVMAILIFKCTKGAGVGCYSSGGRGVGWEKLRDCNNITAACVHRVRCTSNAGVWLVIRQ